ncbi:LAFA_0F07448g1_1 [Lachancea sp. 'fantastica']|nr:LAFA_0F07448g1_1 [Lachancea sp. 'fantastica']
MIFGRLSNSRRFYNQWGQLARIYRNCESQNVSARLPTKLELMTASKTVRCGVVVGSLTSQRDSAFLSALLADVYATDQYWFREFHNRYRNGPDPQKTGARLIRYAAALDVQKEGQTTVYGLPSPWLREHGVELHETDAALFQKDASSDGCHLYLDINSQLADSKSQWPILKVTDSNAETPLGSREVNSEKALSGVLKFMESKRNVNLYLKNLEASNFLPVTKNFGSVLDNKPQIIQNLGKAVVQNIYNTDTAIQLHEKARALNLKVEHDIADWTTQAHTHLLSDFKPRLDQFVHDQLSVFKVYSYSESKMELKLRELCNLADSSGVTERIDYLRGQLSLPQVPDSSPSNRIFDRIPTLHKNVNKLIYKQFFTLQLPLVVCSTFGLLSGQFSAYSMGSLAMLGIVLGASRVMKRWSSMLNHFEDEIIDAKRVEIESARKTIQNEWSRQFGERELNFQKKVQLLKHLEEE